MEMEMEKRGKMYLFGDSITEESFGESGWGASLSNHFCRTVDVVLRGYSGYNTRWALKVLHRVFPPAPDDGQDPPPIAVTVFFGANDACLPDRCSAFQHVPLTEYCHNLNSIVAFFKKRCPNTLILLISPPPIDEDARIRFPYAENRTGLPERTNEAAGAYAKACGEVAKECNVPFIDLWSKMQHISDWNKTYLWDGLHLSRAGNQFVFEQVVTKLKEAGGLSVEKMRVHLPLISDIDPTDPLKAFHY